MTKPWPRVAASSRNPGSSALARCTKSSSSPLMLVFRWVAKVASNDSLRGCSPPASNAWPVRYSMGRRLMRAAAVSGAGKAPIRLMPRPAQSRGWRCGFCNSMTISPNRSANGRMFRSVGTLPAALRTPSSVIAPSLMPTSQSSKALMLRATSSGWIWFTGTTATCLARDGTAVLVDISISEYSNLGCGMALLQRRGKRKHQGAARHGARVYLRHIEPWPSHARKPGVDIARIGSALAAPGPV